jgi:hypothetical protein
MSDIPRWFETKNLYVVMEGPNCLADAQQFAKTNERHAPVFYAMGEPDLDQKGILILPDGTEEAMTFAQAANIQRD